MFKRSSKKTTSQKETFNYLCRALVDQIDQSIIVIYSASFQLQYLVMSLQIRLSVDGAVVLMESQSQLLSVPDAGTNRNRTESKQKLYIGTPLFSIPLRWSTS